MNGVGNGADHSTKMDVHDGKELVMVERVQHGGFPGTGKTSTESSKTGHIKRLGSSRVRSGNCETEHAGVTCYRSKSI